MKEIEAGILEGKYEDILAAVQSPVIALTELIKNAADSCLSKEDPITVKIDSVNKIIEIIDTGEGISEYELQNLGKAGYSSKMVGNKTTSPINNPLTGSKGLGLMTAFFISDSLEIRTFSTVDQKKYYVKWAKGEQKYTYEEIEEKIVGTTILLKNIDDEKLKMILLPEEKVKLFMTSLRFFTNAPQLPKIRLMIDGLEECYYPIETLEEYYDKNRRDDLGFIAKAAFTYNANKVTLSYEDNISGFYNFANKVIDLEDRNSVNKFALDINMPDKGIVPIRKISESEVFDEVFRDVSVPAFSGVFYTWRNKKDEKLEQWPVGVRIYVNDYSLYRYLDKDNDWLNLSEISQNVKATNYKLKNTYGYLDIDGYNENQESLKISKERNDFVDSLSQRKFMKIMREVIMVAFTRIDMAVKKPPIKSLALRDSNVTVRMGEKIALASHIMCNHIGLNDIQVSYDKTVLSMDEDWNISSMKPGTYEVELSYDGKVVKIQLNYKEKVPEFALTKDSIVVYKGNTVNLRDYIARDKCKDLLVEDIEITPQAQSTIIRNDYFTKDNMIGSHVVLYRYGEFQRTMSIKVREIEKQPGGGAKSPRIDALFTNLDLLQSKSFKIPELIEGISKHYLESPTLCMAAIRILIESSCKTFFQLLKVEENHFSFPSLVSRTMNLQSCNKDTPDYKTYIEGKDKKFIEQFVKISSQYNVKLSKDVKTNINNHLDAIDLDMFVHNPLAVASDITVYKSMQIFSPLLNYIYEVLLIEE